MVEIIPAVLTDSPAEAAALIQRCNGVVRRVQIDVIDGVFADNRTIDPAALQELDVSLAYDFHLMVKEPVNWVEKCAAASAERIIGQIEMMTSQEEFVAKVQAKNLRVGLAVDLDTEINRIEKDLLNIIDVILIMSVKAGRGGQKFEKKSISKIKELNDIRIAQKSAFRICVDGGETEDVIDDSYLVGADEIVIGRRLFNGDLAANIRKMQEASVANNGRV